MTANSLGSHFLLQNLHQNIVFEGTRFFKFFYEVLVCVFFSKNVDFFLIAYNLVLGLKNIGDHDFFAGKEFFRLLSVHND